MKHIILVRTKEFKNKQTIGNLIVLNDHDIIFSCKTIELPWRDNKRNISSVPAGKYKIVYEHSPRFKKKLWELKGVPNRSECKIHTANYARQLNGCIGLGKYFRDIDNDGNVDVTNSRNSVNKFHSIMFPDTSSFITIIDDID